MWCLFTPAGGSLRMVSRLVVLAEGEWQLQSWGSQMDLIEGLETVWSLSMNPTTRSSALSQGSKARFTVSSPQSESSVLHPSSSEEVDMVGTDQNKWIRHLSPSSI